MIMIVNDNAIALFLHDSGANYEKAQKKTLVEKVRLKR